MFSRYKVKGDPGYFKGRILSFIDSFPKSIFLDSNVEVANEVPVTGTRYSYIAGCGIREEFLGSPGNLGQLQSFIDKQQQAGNWVFGYFSYDFKNELENLSSSHNNYTDFPLFHFFIPEFIFLAEEDSITVLSESAPVSVWNDVLKMPDLEKVHHSQPPVHIAHISERENYYKVIRKLLKHIQQGDIYEVNYCHEIKGISAGMNPLHAYRKLNSLSPNPFSCYYRVNHNHLLCASPERFMTKRGSVLMSQPMKGTAARGHNAPDDQFRRDSLFHSEKERSENIMIVDLVRNDLSKVAVKGSVKVDELCEVYSFARVHQMISSVSCVVKPKVSFIEIIKALFPMGSMTGAPKISAMKIIEASENFQRSIFSGTVGYINPDGDFDFNVVIRSILYNESNGHISVAAGGAITASSEPENEYLETLVKLTPQLESLGINVESKLKEFLNDSIA